MTVYVLQEEHETYVSGVFASVELAVSSLASTYPNRTVSIVRSGVSGYSGRIVTTVETSENGEYPTTFSVTECEVFDTVRSVPHY